MPELQLKRWRIKGTVLSPLHIGCGETLDPFRCVYADGKLHEFDLARALEAADPRTRSLLEQRLAAPLTTIAHADEVRKLLWQLPWREYVLRSFDLSPTAARDFERDPLGALRNIEIQLHACNTLTGRRIIPGSSLKGAMRTGMVSARSASYSGPADWRQPQDFEKAVLGYARIEEDPFGEWKTADVTLDTQTRLADVETFYMTPDRESKDYGFLFETVPVGQTFTAELRYQRRRRVADSAVVQWDRWLRAINAQTKRALDLAYPANHEFYEDTQDSVEIIEEEINRALASANCCVLRLGRFSGFLFMTVDRQRRLTSHREHRPPDMQEKALPVTRTLARDGRPFGFVKLEFEPL